MGNACRTASARLMSTQRNFIIDVEPKCYFSSKLSTARPGAVKESILQQTGCLHYGRHDIFTFFRNMEQLLYYCYKKGHGAPNANTLPFSKTPDTLRKLIKKYSFRRVSPLFWFYKSGTKKVVGACLIKDRSTEAQKI